MLIEYHGRPYKLLEGAIYYFGRAPYDYDGDGSVEWFALPVSFPEYEGARQALEQAARDASRIRAALQIVGEQERDAGRKDEARKFFTTRERV